MLKNVFLFTSVLIFTQIALAKDIPVQVRLFAGSTGVNPTNVNDAITTEGMKKMESVSQLGLEITYPIAKYLDVGARLAKKIADSQPEDSSNDYSVKLDQDAFMLIARVPFVKTDIYRIDAFAGVGGTNTKLNVKTSSQDGEFTKSVGESWYASPYAAAGASVSVGYKFFYVVFEGGIESNKVKDLKSSGTVNSSIDTLDLSGSYFSLGLMFDGVPGSVGK